MTTPMRIHKWMSQQGIASRREAERWILSGRVSVNGEVVQNLGLKIDPERDRIVIDGQPIRNERPPLVYWLLHKPKATLTSRRSDDHKATIFDLPTLKNLSFLVNPVGRLDFLTEGLLLLSNDGELVHRLSHPRFKLAREYYVLVSRRLTEAELNEFKDGIKLEDGPVERVEIRFAHSQKVSSTRGFWYFVTIYEGRNRLVRRLFEHFDVRVLRLVRYGFGSLRLPEDLPPGNYRQLSSDEIKDLKAHTNLLS